MRARSFTQEASIPMLSLDTVELDILAESFYLRDCGWSHVACWSCGSDLHAGMLVHVGPQGTAHTRCLLPRRAVHQLHQLVTGYRDARRP